MNSSPAFRVTISRRAFFSPRWGTRISTRAPDRAVGLTLRSSAGRRRDAVLPGRAHEQEDG